MPVKNVKKSLRDSNSPISGGGMAPLYTTRLEWDEEVVRPCAAQSLLNGSICSLKFVFSFSSPPPKK